MKSFGLMALKAGCTTYFDVEKNLSVPVTVLRAANCLVSNKRTIEKDGYSALQIAYDECSSVRDSLINKPVMGFLKKNNVANRRFFKEFRVNDENFVNQFNLGDQIGVDIFEKTLKVDVTALTKGRGFTGVMKRYNFKCGPASHGNSVSHRMLGSTGQRTDPGKTFKNKKMPTRYGFEQVTTKNLKIVHIDHENGFILVKGAVPGANGSFVCVKMV
jgi:large subunit ribosomal protein L3